MFPVRTHEETLEYLRKAPDAERWCWMADRLKDGDEVMADLAEGQKVLKRRVATLERCKNIIYGAILSVPVVGGAVYWFCSKYGAKP